MERIEKMFQQIEMNMKQMNDKFDAFTLEMNQMKDENKKLKEKVAQQEGRITYLERETRKNNIIIKGVVDEENENTNKTEEKVANIIQKIGTDINVKEDLEQTRRIGKYIKDKKRPILVKVIRGNKKVQILQNARKLKGTDIWIDEDYTKEVVEERKMLIPHMKEARNKGHRAQLKYNKLIINDEIYRANDFTNKEELIKEGRTENTSMKRTVTERSPEGTSFEEQLRKITRTGRKN